MDQHHFSVKAADLVEGLCRRCPHDGLDAPSLRRLAGSLESVLRGELEQRCRRLDWAFAPFDPDSEVHGRERLSETQQQSREAALREELYELFRQASFRRLSTEELHASVRAASDWGLTIDVDLAAFAQLDVFVRGTGKARRTIRRWRNGGRRFEVEMPIFQRLAVMFRLRSVPDDPESTEDDVIHLKLFRQIPCSDVELLLPKTRVRMSAIDQLKVWAPAATGASLTGWKLVQGAAGAAMTSTAGMLSLLVLLGGAFGYASRSFFGYVRTRERCHQNLLSNLYFRSLASNAGVISGLVREAGEQEFREALLAWFVLHSSKMLSSAGGSSKGDLSPQDLDSQVEQLIREICGQSTDFEVDDALAKLSRLGLVSSEGDRIRCCSPDEAVTRLEAHWSALFHASLPAAEEYVIPKPRRAAA